MKRAYQEWLDTNKSYFIAFIGWWHKSLDQGHQNYINSFPIVVYVQTLQVKESAVMADCYIFYRKKGGKDQESIHSCTTPDPGYYDLEI